MGRVSTADSIKEYFSKGVNKSKWAEAKEKAKSIGSYEKYDDGKYTVQLVSIKTARSKKGRLQVVMGFKFTSGEYKGKSHFKYIGIEDSMDYLLNDLKIMGYDDPDMEEIEDVIFKELNKKKPVMDIRLKTKEGTEFQNTYLAKPTEVKEEEESEDEENEPDSEAAEPSTTATKSESEDADDESEESSDDDDEDGEEEAEEEDSEDDEDAEEKPAKKEKSKPKAEEPEEDEKPAEEPEGAKLDVGTQVVVRVNDKEIKAKVLAILKENKDNTGEIRVESLKTGKKYRIAVPDDIVDIINV